MRSEFDELKRFAVVDILSVSGKEKATSTINKHIDNIIDVAMTREQHQQSKVDELQLKLSEESRILHNVIDIEYKKRDELQKLVNAVKTLIEEYRDPPTEDKTFQHALSIVADELEQALKGGDK